MIISDTRKWGKHSINLKSDIRSLPFKLTCVQLRVRDASGASVPQLDFEERWR